MNNYATTATPDFEHVKLLMGKFPKPDFGSLVMTHSVFAKLKDATEPGNVTADRLFGFPIYVYATLKECLDMMME